jgi:hypothetical protein
MTAESLDSPPFALKCTLVQESKSRLRLRDLSRRKDVIDGLIEIAGEDIDTSSSRGMFTL